MLTVLVREFLAGLLAVLMGVAPAAQVAPQPAEEQSYVQEIEAVSPARTLSAKAGTMSLEVDSPVGSLPKAARASLTKVSKAKLNRIRKEAATLLGTEILDAVAFDISFLNNGIEIEPDGKVSITVNFPAIAEAPQYTIIHFRDDGSAEVIPGNVTRTSATFSSDAFSVYAVVGTEVIVPRLTVTFKNGDTTLATMYVKKADTVSDIETIVYDPGAGTVPAGQSFKGWTTDKTYTLPIYNDQGTQTGGSTILSIAGVRTAVQGKASELTNADAEVTYYAAIFKSYKVTYQSDDDDPITVATASVEYPAYQADGTEASYTVNAGFTVDDTHNFEGWSALDETSQSHIKNYPTGASSEETADGTVYYYENGAVIAVTGDITFTVRAPEGSWLIFDENGKGATYTAPQFVLTGENTVTPSTIDRMQRVGYTFGGWYDTKEHAEAHAANTSVTEGKYVFGNTLTGNTTIYASWVPNTTAYYTVLIWKQSISGNSYDYAESRVLTGTVGQNATGVVKQGSDESAYATINGTALRYTGFHLERFDENVSIVPEGTSVVNVYYDRNTYVLTFEIQGSGYRYERDDTNGTYGYVNGEYVLLGSEVIESTTTTVHHLSQNQNHSNNDAYTGTVYSDQNGTVANNPTYPNTYYRRRTSNNGYRQLYWHTETITTETKAYTYTDSTGTHTYIGPRFTRSTNGWIPVKTIVALYEQPIKDNFPIVGTNNTTYTNSRWAPQNSSTFSQVLVYIDIMPAENVTFHQNTANYTTKHMYYYVEALPGETGETRTYKGKEFVLYKQIDANYNFFTEAEDFVDLVGFSKSSDYPPQGYQSNGTTQVNTIWENSNAIHVYCYYLRDSYRINYMDGVYVDGNNNLIQTHSTNQLTTSDYINYGASLSDYNITPTLPSSEAGYVFEGWYMDEACNAEYDFDEHTMPVNGVTVYAKWRQIQYRAFLHSGLTENDGTNLSWGSTSQSLSFRVSYGGKLSAPTGTRDGYKFLGWYTDAAMTKPFNEDAFVFNEETVTTAYNKETTPTDPETKYDGMSWYGPWDVTTAGATNSDMTGWDHDNDGKLEDGTPNPDATPGIERYWITKKLDLYAKWSKITVGADGINVAYTAVGQDLDGNAVTGSNAPGDDGVYLDNATVTLGAAATAPTGYIFDHWVVCTWDGTKYVPGTVTKFPGEVFNIQVSDAKIIDNSNNTVVALANVVTGGSYTYTVQIMAIYKAVEEETLTHINWYNNDGTGDDGKGELYREDKTLKINEAVYIYGVSKDQTSGTITITVPELSDYLFKGWTKTKGGTTADFLVWDGEKYTTTDGTVVTQVAADEKKVNGEYEDLYAVWEKPFYVYHSGVANGGTDGLEKGYVSVLAKNNETYDLTSAITSGCYYGGYYLKSGITTIPQDGAAYDGTNWAWGTPETDLGTTLTPVAGETYYIKEVPNKYLQQYTHISFLGKTVKALLLVTDIDDSKYTEVGFTYKKSKAGSETVTTVTENAKSTFDSTLEISTSIGSSVTVVEANTVCSDVTTGTGLVGYLMLKGLEVNTTVQVQLWWKTADGVTVTSTAVRTIETRDGTTNPDTGYRCFNQ